VRTRLAPPCGLDGSEREGFGADHGIQERADSGDLRRTWLIVGSLFVTVTVAYGVLQYAFGVLLRSMHRDLGWSRTELTGAFSTALPVEGHLDGQLVSTGAGLVVGARLDRHSPRILMTAGAAASALLVAGWSRANTVGVRGSYRTRV
jgi:hypothetical protein